MPWSLQAADQVEHLGDLAHADRRGRLVHQHDLGVGEPGAGDRHRLALAARHLLDEVARPRLGLELGEQLAGARVHRRDSRGRLNGPMPPLQLAAEEDVGGGRQVVAQREVLVDDLDALARARRPACGSDCASPSSRISPSDGGKLPAMILTSVDLPAPLSPIRPSDLARLESQIDALQRLDRAEMLGDALQLQQRQYQPPANGLLIRRPFRAGEHTRGPVAVKTALRGDFQTTSPVRRGRLPSPGAEAESEPADAVAGLGQTLVRRREAKPDMPRRRAAECVAGQHAHSLFCQEPAANRSADRPVRRTSSMTNMPPLGRAQPRPGQPCEAPTDGVAATPDSARASPRPRHVRSERHRSRILDEGRRAVEHAQREVAGMPGKLRRPDQPADPPAGHGMRLGQAGDRDRALLHAGQAGRRDMLAVEDQRGIDLVGDQPEVVAPAELCHALDLVPVITAPVGLCGELIRIARVRGVTAAARASRSRWKPRSASSGTRTRRAPAAAIVAG